jgi:hypothetical protein
MHLAPVVQGVPPLLLLGVGNAARLAVEDDRDTYSRCLAFTPGTITVERAVDRFEQYAGY